MPIPFYKMTKFTIWTALTIAALAAILPTAFAQVPGRSIKDLPPRKVIVGTVQKGFWGTYPGLEKRLEQLGGIVDEMAVAASKMHGRGLDLAVLPETAVTDISVDDPVARSVPFQGTVHDFFARKARQHGCYIVVPLHLLDDKARSLCSNASVLVDRKGMVLGIYQKMHVVPLYKGDSVSLEGGLTAGTKAAVFECDFGRLGMQICFDMEFEAGWDELARQGADIVVWPTQSPQTGAPAARARKHGFYIVSSTWRNNASIFEPTGKIVAQVRPPGHILVQELDLSYAILPWSGELENGKAFSKRFGDKVGFRYYEDEDRGMFWSNDPHKTIGQMVHEMGLTPEKEYFNRVRETYKNQRAKVE